MKKSLIIIVLITIQTVFAQRNREPYIFGNISEKEYGLNAYQKDSTANAVFLYERGKTVFEVTANRIIIKTKYYAKVKIFNKEGIDHATIKIPIYRNDKSKEQVIDIRGVTHNGIVRTDLLKKHIYTEELNERWSEVKFTMPNIKGNSIIEYEYTLVSPFMFNFSGWEFQSDIPKIYSEFHALIPGNYIYNRRLVGFYKLSKNESKIKRGCFSIPGSVREADCEELIYAMKDIPAFIEEDYLTSKDNYLSAIKFELSEFKGFDGTNHKYTKTWKHVDKEFRTEKSIGKQLRKIDYIKKKLPIDLISGEQNIENARNIYNYIKDRFTWNNKYRLFTEVNVKDAFDKKTGNCTEVNIALINALKAAGYDVELMLVSTRRHGLPTKVHPVMTDFNYAIAKLNLTDESYLLDATEKQMPFGMLPFRTLNGYGRVMNFKKGSYWHTITPKHKTLTRTSLNLKLNKEDTITGKMNTANDGYRGLSQRRKYYSKDQDEYLDQIENKNLDLSILSYKNNNSDALNKAFSEVFEIEIASDLKNKTLIINPFILNKLNENPFKLNERHYPVDFGYGYTDTFTLQLEIPENYNIKSLPKDRAFKLPNDAGMYLFRVTTKGQKISLLSRVKLNKSYFSSQEYPYLKEFFNQIIKTHKSLITLEKINSTN